MTIDGPIIEDPDDARYGYRITDVPNEDAQLLPLGDELFGMWIRMGSSLTPKGLDRFQLEERFIRKEHDPAHLAYENGYRDGYDEAMKDMAKRQLAKVEDELESLRDRVILAVRGLDEHDMTDELIAALAALDTKTGYKPA